MSTFKDLLGTTRATFRIGKTGNLFKDVGSSILALRNSSDAADAELRVSKLSVSGDTIDILNSDAAGSGADWRVTITRPGAGMTAHQSYTWPVNSSDGVLTNTGGVMSWQPNTAAPNTVKTDTTTLVFGASSPLTLFSTAAGEIITKIQVFVDTAFNGTPSVSLGIAGNTAKYAIAADIDLTTAAAYEITPGLPAGGVEALIATYAAGGATVGSARIVIHYTLPN